jgi:hypothetical protein
MVNSSNDTKADITMNGEKLEEVTISAACQRAVTTQQG